MADLYALRKMQVIDAKEEVPIFCIVDHLLSLALHDDAESAKSPKI